MGTVFTSRTEEHSNRKKLVGVHIVKNDAHRLALLSLQKGIPRTQILLDLIDGYLEEEPSLLALIETAVNRAFKHWSDKVSTKGDTPKQAERRFKVYLNEVKQDLVTHRIDKDIIPLIIKDLKELI